MGTYTALCARVRYRRPPAGTRASLPVARSEWRVAPVRVPDGVFVPREGGVRFEVLPLPTQMMLPTERVGKKPAPWR